MGNVMAMLAAWLGSRAQQQPIVLRIEDIDGPRVAKDADRWIMDDLNWLGLNWDGEPVYQSDRSDLYMQALRTLAEQPTQLYPCFCSRAEIRAASAPQQGDGFVRYPGTCRVAWSRHDPPIEQLAATDFIDSSATADAAATKQSITSHTEANVPCETRRHAWRLAVPEPGDAAGLVQFDDLIQGAQSFDLGRDLGDTVLRRSDGLFAYQLAVTVDDLLQGVTQIVRGRDLLRSTALQLHIRQLLMERGFVQAVAQQGSASQLSTSTEHVAQHAVQQAGSQQSTDTASDLEFAHLALIDNAAGVRLAKRTRSLDLGYLRTQGVQPEQIIGYCAALLGLNAEGVTYDEQGHIDPMREDFNPAPMTAQQVLEAFSWQAVRAVNYDKALPDDLANRLSNRCAE
ncbi:glutamyl-Q tRNA(Asp) ligase [Bifidobacterium dolichotidis]|uniref:Glutamyl-Q tRNA(Asp) ligase n=2 Tax=Bifidobacterium dolichotidis TaxID=2306976 RepID=A0A430FRF4_9BIFI|nr:glutamyl-Q tRNA(Asp) ligase [Bifidobacterium dolichotidis]